MPVCIGDAKFIKGYRIDGMPSDRTVLCFDAASGVFEWRDFYEVAQNVAIVYAQASIVVSSDPRPTNPANGTLIYETDTGLSWIWIGSDWYLVGAQAGSSADRRNIQLLFLGQAISRQMTAGYAVDGFYDALEDLSGIDLDLTKGGYSETGAFFYGVEGQSVASSSFTVSSNSQFVRADDRGSIRYWYQDSGYHGHFECIEKTFQTGAVVNRGNGLCGFPAVAHGLSSGGAVRFYGFSNPGYNAIFTVNAASSANEIVVSGSYVAENMPEGGRHWRKIPGIGSGQECPYVEAGSFVTIAGATVQIVWIDTSVYGIGASRVGLSGLAASGDVTDLAATYVADGALQLATYFDPDGSRNASVTDAVPALTDGSNVGCSSNTTTWYGWKIFDNNYGTGYRWLTAAGQTTGWVSYDFGAGNAKVINKYRWLTMETDSNAVPGAWQLQGSNDNATWVTLHSGTNSVQTGNTWIGYFTFRNSVAYRYYRFNVTANCGHATYLTMDDLELIAAPNVAAPALSHPVIMADAYVYDCGEWEAIISGTVTGSNPGTTKTYYALSWDLGITWNAFVGGAWRQIARENAGMWEYRNALGAWATASVNSVHGALRAACGIAANCMDGTVYNGLDSGDWGATGGWTNGAVGIKHAVIMQGSGAYCPTFSGSNFSHAMSDIDIDVVSKVYDVSGADPERLTASLLIKNRSDTTKVFVSSGEEIEWTEMGALTKSASLANGVEFHSATLEGYDAAGWDMRLRVFSAVGHDTELHGFALSWG